MLYLINYNMVLTPGFTSNIVSHVLVQPGGRQSAIKIYVQLLIVMEYILNIRAFQFPLVIWERDKCSVTRLSFCTKCYLFIYV